MIIIPRFFVDIDLDMGSEEVYDNICENTKINFSDDIIISLSDTNNIYLLSKKEIKKIVKKKMKKCSKYYDDDDWTYWHDNCADKTIYNLFVNKLNLNRSTRYFESLMDYIYELQIRYAEKKIKG